MLSGTREKVRPRTALTSNGRLERKEKTRALACETGASHRSGGSRAGGLPRGHTREVTEGLEESPGKTEYRAHSKGHTVGWKPSAVKALLKGTHTEDSQMEEQRLEGLCFRS